jgi:hypothetical protein
MGRNEAMPHPRSSAVCQNQNQKQKAMKKATFHTIAGLLAVGLAFGVNFAQAQTGTLDPKFGKGGTVTTTFTGAGSPVMLPIGAAQQADGDIVVLSQFDFVSDEGTQIGLTRYTPARQAG